MKNPKIFFWSVVVLFTSLKGFSQYYVPSNSLGSSREKIWADSVFFQPNGDWGFFSYFRNEMELEQFLILNLRPYVDSERFYVSVRYDPEGGRDSIQTDNPLNEGGLPPQLEPESQPLFLEGIRSPNQRLFTPPLDLLPVLPNYWNRNQSELELDSLGVTPDTGFGSLSLNDPESDLLEEDGEGKFLLGKVSVHFIADPGINVEVEDLMRKVAYYSLKLYAFEAYEVTFERISLHRLFPVDGLDTTKSSVDSTFLGISNTSSADQQLRSDSQSVLSELFRPRNLLYILLFLVLLGLLLYLLLRNRSLTKKQEREDTLNHYFTQSQENPEKEEPEEEEPEQSSVETELPEEIRRPSQIVSDRFEEYFVRNTAEIGKVFTYWIEDLGDQGLHRVHSILMPLGKNMYTLLFPYLSNPATQTLLKSLYKEDRTPATEEERRDYIEKLMEIIANRLGIDSLALLNSLEKWELFDLIDILEEKDAAKALYHLQAQDRAEYLQSVSPNRAAKILVNVTAIRTMSKVDYDQLGDLISNKLVELRFFKKYLNKDLQFMLESLDTIDYEVQELIMDNLKISDPDLYKEIKRHQLSWSDVETLDPELVREATLSFTSEELGIAYYYRPEDVGVIVALRPEREQQVIRELAYQKESVTESDAKVILKQMLNAIKTRIQDHAKKR